MHACGVFYLLDLSMASLSLLFSCAHTRASACSGKAGKVIPSPGAPEGPCSIFEPSRFATSCAEAPAFEGLGSETSHTLCFSTFVGRWPADSVLFFIKSEVCARGVCLSITWYHRVVY